MELLTNEELFALLMITVPIVLVAVVASITRWLDKNAPEMDEDNWE